MDNDVTRGWFMARRDITPWRGRERTRPKMPSSQWRASALVCTAVGAGVAAVLFRSSDALALRVVAGAVVGFLVGMYCVETWFERRTARSSATDPIGRRR